MRFVFLATLAFAGPAAADPAQQQIEIQRALMQRDRQSAEFSRPELRDLHSQQERRVEIRPDERALQARERESVPATRPENAPLKYYRALPLPGGPRHGVDPIPVQGVGG
jgi:hypothetical protein